MKPTNNRHYPVVNRLRKLWRAMPLSYRKKQYMRHILLRYLPFSNSIQKSGLLHLEQFQTPHTLLSDHLLDNILPKIFFPKGQRKIVLVAHDAHPHGGQYLVLHMAKYLRQALGFSVEMLVLGDGILMTEYARYANVHDLSGMPANGKRVRRIIDQLHRRGFRHAFANTVVTGLIVPVLKETGFHVCTLVHELPELIQTLGLQEYINKIAEKSDYIVFPAAEVKDGFLRFAPIADEKIIMLHQGLFRKNKWLEEKRGHDARRKLRERFSLPDESFIVLAVGHADKRKGVDLFVETGIKMLTTRNDIWMLWVGHFDSLLHREIMDKVNRSGCAKHFIFPGMDFDTDIYYAGSDLYALTSREDPFPSVVLEALAAALPVTAFEDSGGFAGLLEKAGGVLVPRFDVDTYSGSLLDLLTDANKRSAIGHAGKNLVEKEFLFADYIRDLLFLFATQPPAVKQ